MSRSSEEAHEVEDFDGEAFGEAEAPEQSGHREQAQAVFSEDGGVAGPPEGEGPSGSWQRLRRPTGDPDPIGDGLEAQDRRS